MLFFSCGTPNLATVVPAMDLIDKVLATSSDDHDFSLSIHSALVIGKNTINCYYNKTDHSETYHIVMSALSFITINTLSLISFHLVLHP
jgi:hypothetical protein